MKRFFLLSLLVGMMCVMAFIGCERETITPNEGQPQQRAEDSITQPEFMAVEVDMSRYHRRPDTTNSYYSYECDCVNYDSAYIINSQSEMEMLIGECHDSLPTIDFNMGTLVYVLYDVPDLVFEKKISFEKLSEQNYALTLSVWMGDLCNGEPAKTIAYYVVPKLVDTDTVNFIKNEYEYGTE